MYSGTEKEKRAKIAVGRYKHQLDKYNDQRLEKIVEKRNNGEPLTKEEKELWKIADQDKYGKIDYLGKYPSTQVLKKAKMIAKEGLYKYGIILS